MSRSFYSRKPPAHSIAETSEIMNKCAGQIRPACQIENALQILGQAVSNVPADERGYIALSNATTLIGY